MPNHRKRAKEYDKMKSHTPFPLNTSGLSAMAMSTTIKSVCCSVSSHQSIVLTTPDHPFLMGTSLSLLSGHAHSFEGMYTLLAAVCHLGVSVVGEWRGIESMDKG